MYLFLHTNKKFTQSCLGHFSSHRHCLFLRPIYQGRCLRLAPFNFRCLNVIFITIDHKCHLPCNTGPAIPRLMLQLLRHADAVSRRYLFRTYLIYSKNLSEITMQYSVLYIFCKQKSIGWMMRCSFFLDGGPVYLRVCSRTEG